MRNYEADLSGTRVSLADLLDPIGVRLVVAEVTGLSVTGRTVTCVAEGRPFELGYDRLVFALGSRLVRPTIPGLHEHAFDVDTYDAGCVLPRISLRSAASRARLHGTRCLVVGAGLTGVVESRRRCRPGCARCLRPNRASFWLTGPTESARTWARARGPSSREALAALGVETRPGVSDTAIDAGGADAGHRRTHRQREP